MRFASKVDGWFLALVGVTGTGMLAGLGYTLLHDSARAIAGISFAALLGVGLPVWMLADTHYTLSDKHLHVCCGPVRQTIALDQIRSVRPSRSLVSSPALSLDRLDITYGHFRSVLISPKDKEGFIHALKAQAPHVEILSS